MTIWKRVLSLLLYAALILALVPAMAPSARADDDMYTITLVTEGQGTAELRKISTNEVVPNGSAFNNENLVVLRAYPADGWQFVSWQKVSGDEGYLIYPEYRSAQYRVRNGNAVIHAVFERASYTVTAAANPAAGGTAEVSLNNSTWSSSVTCYMGDTVYFRQTPADGYVFDAFSFTGNPTVNGSHFTMPASNVTVTANYTAVPVSYIGADGQPANAVGYHILSSSDSTLSAGWYVVQDSVEMGNTRLTVNGAVNLILCDGAALNVPKGITVEGNNSLTIYAQSAGTGALIADDPDSENAGIGGLMGQSCGAVTICGGNITAKGGSFGAAGIGGGAGGDGINGGDGGTVTITGGTVNATGGSARRGGAGIGGGAGDNSCKGGDGGTVTISGGTVTATAGNGDFGIGGG